MKRSRRIFILFQLFQYLPLEPLDVPQPLEPVGGIGVAFVVDALHVDHGGEVAVQRHLSHVTREILIRDNPRRGQVTQLRLQLWLAHNTDPVVLKVKWLD